MVDAEMLECSCNKADGSTVVSSLRTAGCDVVENSDGQLKCGAGAGGPPPAAGEEAVRSFYEEEEAATRAAAAAAQRAGEL
mmetsp:Transcript_19920/g.41760  ORF Transcript_19920/g.41760 Transcript_19920/m.41760 type:complete len:81 (+) Transcript_19920:361-603(+)